MKYFASLLLFVFVIFLSTPTVVALFQKNTSTSLFYSFAEEEIHKELKVVETKIQYQFDYSILDFIKKNTKIIPENLLRHDNIVSEIISPPPKNV